MSKRIVIAAGGTGGHLYPAQGFAQQLLKRCPDFEICFLAGGLNTNRYFDRTKFNYQQVRTGLLLTKNPFKCVKGWMNTFGGIKDSVTFLKEFQPDLFVGFGSFYMVPPLLAAKWLKIPTLLHVADCIPGKANRFFAPFVDSVGVHFPHTIPLIKGNAIEVGLPLREGYEKNIFSKETAARYFHLNYQKKILLVFGGSQGAQSINRLLKEAANDLGEYQVIHITGQEESVEGIANHYKHVNVSACVKAFEKQMNLAWIAADVFIGRSGASTIAEAMEFEVPGLLVPYPYSADHHQDKNADFFVKHVGGGIKWNEDLKNLGDFKKQMKTILNDEWQRERQAAIQAYRQRPSRLDLCDLALTYLLEEK